MKFHLPICSIGKVKEKFPVKRLKLLLQLMLKKQHLTNMDTGANPNNLTSVHSFRWLRYFGDQPSQEKAKEITIESLP